MKPVRPLPPLVLALLAGCAAGPEFSRPQPAGSQRYSAAELPQVASQSLIPGASVNADWWKLFGSADIDRIVEQALSGNRSLEAAVASLDEARELAQADAGGLLPQIGLTSGIGRQKYGSQFLGSLPAPPPFTYFAIGPRISYALDYTGSAKRGVERQRALAEVRLHQVEAARLAISGNAVMQALRIASLREQIATVEQLLGRDEENLRLVEEAHAAGSVSQLDVLTARSQLASDATVLPALRQQLEVARHALGVIVGVAPADAALPEPALADITLPAELPLAVPSELAHRRPDILAAEAELHAATAAVGVATGNLYPRITLTASIGQESTQAGDVFDRSSNVFSLAAGLVAPIFDGGTLRARKRAAVAGVRASAAHYQQTVLEAFGQIADTLQALGHDAEALQTHSNAASTARETADLTRNAYQEGEATIVQVVDSERRYQQAQLGLVGARAQRYIDSMQLLLAIGPGAAQ